MLTIRRTVQKDFDTVFKFVKDFYHSEAVDHEVDDEVLKNTLQSAIDVGNNLDGYVLCEDEVPVGFAYVTSFFACEVGGTCVMIEELYLTKEAQGKGYGSKFFEYVFEHYPNARRYRLEVTAVNKRAIGLYKRFGFDNLSYVQMVKETP